MALIFVLVAAAVAILLLMVLATSLFGPVPRVRVGRFARRQGLLITPGNGNLVIRYLATTRRWRSVGLLVAVLVAAAWSLRDQRLTVNFGAAFAGWFVGAVIAELRFAEGVPGDQPVASLEPRLLRDRLRPAARVLPVAAFGLCLVVATLVLVDGGEPVRLLVPLLLAVAGLGVPALVGRRILTRSRPLNRPGDLIAADDALRDRSLHVLAGSTVALLGYPLALLLALAELDATDLDAGAVATLALVVLPVAGWVVATRSRPATANRTAGQPQPLPSR